MSASKPTRIVAVDVGNSRMKLGMFDLPAADPLPHPHHTAALEIGWKDAELDAALTDEATECAWTIASVNRSAANRLVESLAQRGVRHVKQVVFADMPIEIDVAHPESVGVDRLADAVAANRLRDPHVPAIVVDHGSALTVNLVNQHGVFAGGAILPGINMTARALHEFTDGLPYVEVTDAPFALERSTAGAIRFGLYWGAVGAVREVIARLAQDGDTSQIFLTGGGGPALAAALAQDGRWRPQFVPHLTLAGVALCTEAARETS